VEFPSFKDAEGFNPEDPRDELAEKIRKAVAEAVAGVGPDLSNEEMASATIAGLLVGVTGVVACCTKPEGHREVAATLSAQIPWAMNMARSILGLPEITDQ
jgi:hypothetical protein